MLINWVAVSRFSKHSATSNKNTKARGKDRKNATSAAQSYQSSQFLELRAPSSIYL